MISSLQQLSIQLLCFVLRLKMKGNRGNQSIDKNVAIVEGDGEKTAATAAATRH